MVSLVEPSKPIFIYKDLTTKSFHYIIKPWKLKIFSQLVPGAGLYVCRKARFEF